MGKAEREKGKRGEREFVHAWNELGLPALRRSQQYCGTETSADTVPVDDHELGIHFEVKRVEKLNLKSAYKQAASDCGDGVPVVAHKRNRDQWMLTFSLGDLLVFIDRVSAARNRAKGD